MTQKADALKQKKMIRNDIRKTYIQREKFKTFQKNC